MATPLPCSKSFMTYYASNMSVTVNANCYLRKGLLNGSIDSLLVASEDCQVSNCKTLLTEIFVYTSIDCTFVEAQTGNQWRFSKLKDFCAIPLRTGHRAPDYHRSLQADDGASVHDNRESHDDDDDIPRNDATRH